MEMIPFFFTAWSLDLPFIRFNLEIEASNPPRSSELLFQLLNQINLINPIQRRRGLLERKIGAAGSGVLHLQQKYPLCCGPDII
jgi:hypothetical protein